MYPHLAFHSCDLYAKVVAEDTFEEEMEGGEAASEKISYELDHLIEASPASTSIFDII